MSKRIFVGNLPYSTTENDLRDMFAKFGTVSTCDLIIDRFTNRSKGFAFVEMSNDEETDKAISALDGQELSGRKMVVNVAKPKEDSRGDRGDRRNFNRGDRNFDRKRSFSKRGSNDNRGRNRW